MIEILRKVTIPFAGIMTIMLAATLSAAQQPTPPQQASPQPPQSHPKGCLAVASIGSHTLRNVLLMGGVGAFISKEQYKVVDVSGYPARVGEKLHGNDLQTIQGNGTKVVLLTKKYTQDELRKACE